MVFLRNTLLRFNVGGARTALETVARLSREAGRETAPSCSRRLNAASATLGYGDRSDLFEMPPERYRSLIHRTRRPKDGIG